MVRSRWIKAFMATLVSTGLAVGQQAAPSASPSSPGKDDPTGRIISVSEAGKPAQKCKVVKWWTDAKGQRNLQVEVVGTGEMMTIVETGVAVAGAPANGPRTITTTIFHWGKGKRPPEGVPVPPDMAPPAPAMPKAVPIVSSPPPPAAMNPTTTKAPAPLPRIETAPTTVTTVVEPPKERPSLLGRVFNREKPTETRVTVVEPMKRPEVTVVTPASPTTKPEIRTVTSTEAPRPTTVPPSKTVAAIEPAKTGDWRESWGKTEGKKDDAGATAKKPPEVRTTAAEKVEKTSSESKKPDPLADPAKYARMPEDLRSPRTEAPKKHELPPLPVEPRKADLPLIAPPAPAPTPAPAVKTTSSATPAPMPTTPTTTASEPTVQQTHGGSTGLGARSVVDSGATSYAPVPFVTMPAGPMPRPTWQPPQPPRFTPQMGNAPACDGGGVAPNAFTPHESIPPAPYTPMASMTSNAFSSGFGIPPNHAALPAPGVFGPPRPPMPVPPPGAMPGPRVPPGGHAMATPPAPFGPSVQVAMGPANPAAPGAAPTGGITTVAYQTASAPMTTRADGPGTHMTQLREALYPSQREQAAEKLASCDWRTNEMVVPALLQGAREDPAATVRIACINSLTKMKADTLPVVMAMQALKNDADARVRHQAEEALKVLAPNLKATPAMTPTTPGALPALGTK